MITANVKEEIMDARESPSTTVLYIGGQKIIMESPSTTVLYIGGQKIIMEGEKTEITPEAYTLLYIGMEPAHLRGILMRYSNVDCFSYDLKTMSTHKEGAAINLSIMR
ncbi:hypothetical protein PsorP6_011914 [Peronosclerospora sorghi]|uniref:Uncharacterized protein n=1 Tax=Peronosclerospora sorghi TaxID=230839 RepID=A0ACC0WM17_9STRA|nr:hypothetical protein PsorP6_011914 [Peronosclerospora sorghi]